MSEIFDALQRAEAERTGLKTSKLPSATELLEHAERQAAAQWSATAAVDPLPGHGGNGNGRAVPEGAMLAVATPAGADAAVAGYGASERRQQFAKAPISLKPESRLVCVSDKESAAAEAFRLLGVRLRHLRRDRALKSVLVTSTIPQEGKSMVSANLSCALAQRTQNGVILVEGDLRRPSLSEKFGLTAAPGMCEWMRGEKPLTECIYRLEDAGIWIFPAGNSLDTTAELLEAGQVTKLLEQLGTWFEWVIIDSPPVLPLADTSVWSRAADGILLVTRRGTTERKLLEKGIEALETQKLVGAVLNHCTRPDHSDYYYSRNAGGTDRQADRR